MYSKIISFCSLFVLSLAHGQEDFSEPVDSMGSNDSVERKIRPKQKTKPLTFKGAIPDTSSGIILGQTPKLKPIYGFEDVFIVKSSNAIIDVSDIGPSESLYLELTHLNVVSGEGQPEKNQFRISASASEGDTQLLWYKKDPQTGEKRGALLKVHNVHVTNTDLFTLIQELEALIGNVEGIKLRIVGGRVVVDGQVLAPREYHRVQTVLSGFANKILNLVEVSPLTLQILGKKMEEEIAGGPDRPRDIRVKVVKNRFFLEGYVDRNSDALAALEICKSYFPYEVEIQVELMDVPLGQCVNLVKIRQPPPGQPDPVLSVRIDFVTLAKSYAREFDFKWNPGLSLNGNSNYTSDTGKFLTTFTATISNLFPKLNAASSRGYSRILKSATILVKDGSPDQAASISEKLNFPYRVSSGQVGVPPTFATAVVETNISIKAESVSGSDKVNLSVDAKASEVGARPFGEDGPPQTSENTIKTFITVSNGESAALGGLISDRRKVDFTRDPGADAKNDIQVISLNKGQTFEDRKDQFVIFVTPRRLRSTGEGTDSLKRKFRLRK